MNCVLNPRNHSYLANFSQFYIWVFSALGSDLCFAFPLKSIKSRRLAWCIYISNLRIWIISSCYFFWKSFNIGFDCKYVKRPPISLQCLSRSFQVSHFWGRSLALFFHSQSFRQGLWLPLAPYSSDPILTSLSAFPILQRCTPCVWKLAFWIWDLETLILFLVTIGLPFETLKALAASYIWKNLFWSRSQGYTVWFWIRPEHLYDQTSLSNQTSLPKHPTKSSGLLKTSNSYSSASFHFISFQDASFTAYQSLSFAFSSSSWGQWLLKGRGARFSQGCSQGLRGRVRGQWRRKAAAFCNTCGVCKPSSVRETPQGSWRGIWIRAEGHHHYSMPGFRFSVRARPYQPTKTPPLSQHRIMLSVTMFCWVEFLCFLIALGRLHSRVCMW